MQQYISEVTEQTVSMLKKYHLNKLIGIGGTATTLSSMVQQLEVYDMQKVHHSLVDIAEVEAMVELLKSKTLDERMMIKGLDPKRADVITAGLTILHTLMKALDMQEIMISEYDNLEGLVYSKQREN